MSGTDVLNFVCYVLEHFEDLQSQSLTLQNHFKNKNTFGFCCHFLKV